MRSFYRITDKPAIWISASLVIAVADWAAPAWAGLCVLQIAVLLLAWRMVPRLRMAKLTATFAVMTILPGVLSVLTNFGNDHGRGFEPTRLWVVLTIFAAGLFYEDQQRRRHRRLKLRRELQRKVRRRAVQIRRINEALRREVGRRHATQALLTRTETHLQSLAERMQLQVLRKDRDGVITYANDAFCSAIGRSPNEVIGSTDDDLYPPSSANTYRADDSRVMTTGLPVDHIESHPTADGKTGWVQVFKAPQYDERGDCIGIQMVFWDVTDSYRKTTELRRSEARKRALFEAAREAVLLVDENGIIVEANPAAEELLGHDDESLSGRMLDNIARPDLVEAIVADSAASSAAATDRISEQPQSPADNEWPAASPQRWLDLPKSERREMHIRRAGGISFPAEVSVHPIPLESSHGLAVFVRDVTLRHRALEALRQAKQAAEDANRIKSEFMASVSHEIRTPLGGITGSAELLARMDLPARAAQYVEMIRQSGELLSEVIGDILDFSSIEAGRLRIDPQPIDLHACLAAAMRSLAPKAIGKPLELILEIDPDVPRSVVADPKRLRQVIINLVGNAIKFTPQGYVWVRLTAPPNTTFPAPSITDRHRRSTPIDSVDSSRGGDTPGGGSLTDPRSPDSWRHVMIEVIDSGIGIDAQRLDKVFEPFEQGDSGTTRRFGGTGLGLSISDQLIRRMGGLIKVTSQEGEGSVFRCHLPLPIASSDAIRSPLDAEVKPDARLIALHVAHPVQRQVLARWCRNQGLRVVEDWRIDSVAPGVDVRIIDQSLPPQQLEAIPAIGDRSESPGRIIWIASVDTPAPEAAKPDQPVLFKPIIPDELRLCLSNRAPQAAWLRTPPEEAMAATMEASGIEDARGERSLPPSDRRGHLLVVDDSRVNQAVIRDFLLLGGFTSDVAASGPAAVDAVEHHAYDAILMDLQMPGMDGIEATQKILGSYRSRVLRPPPIVALTAHATGEHEARCLQAGMCAFLIKPIEPDKLLSTVHQVLRLSDTAPQRRGVDPQDREEDRRDAGSVEPDSATEFSEPPQGDWKAKMLRSAGGDSDTFIALIDAFIDEVPQLCETLRQAIEQGNIREVRRTAHTLKSCLKYVAPAADYEIAQRIELAAQTGDLETAARWLDDAQRVASQWVDRVRSLVK